MKGFTLLEVLFTLAILSILITLSAPLTISSLAKHQEKQFFQTLQFDVMLVQNLSINNNNYIRIKLNDKSYELINGARSKPIAIRNLPKKWYITKQNLDTISFNRDGSIRRAGTIKITTEQSSYNVVFPLGKGRGYINIDKE